MNIISTLISIDFALYSDHYKCNFIKALGVSRNYFD